MTKPGVPAVLCLLISIWFVSSAHAKPYDKDYVGEMETHRAVFEDTLVHLARHHGLGFVEIRAANPTLDPWIPGRGAKVVLPLQHLLPDAPREGIVINLPEMRLYLFDRDGNPPETYSIGIGREGLNTPTGRTKIARKKIGPSWRPTERMREEDPDLPEFVPAGPENPLGTHAMYLGWPQYAIHGTNKPYGIGRRVSSGCIRMYPEGVRDLFPKVAVGMPVSIVDQPVKVGWIGSEMYVEVHPSQDQSFKVEEEGLLRSYEITADDMRRITKAAGTHADKIDWAAVREAVRDHHGYPVSVLDRDGPVIAVRDEDKQMDIAENNHLPEQAEETGHVEEVDSNSISAEEEEKAGPVFIREKYND